jgi:hypothetical protein
MTSATVRCALVLAALAFTGCTLDKPVWLEQKRANDAEASFYVEQEWEGRLYVFGTSKAHAAFQTTHEMPYCQTFIGAGPQGQTVRIEADARELGLQNRLRRRYEERHGALPE